MGIKITSVISLLVSVISLLVSISLVALSGPPVEAKPDPSGFKRYCSVCHWSKKGRTRSDLA